MKLALIADTHLYPSSKTISVKPHQTLLHKLAEEAFEELTNKLLDSKAEIVVIAGDIFDERSPKHKELEFFVKHLTRIAEEKEVVIVAGNHDINTRELDSYLRLFKYFKHVHVFDPAWTREVLKGRARPVEIAGVKLLPLPHPGRKNTFDRAKVAYLAAIRGLEYDYIVGHRSTESYKFGEDDFFIPEASFKSLALLGHVHRRAVGEKFIYPGSMIAAPISHFNESISPQRFAIPIVSNGRVEEEIEYEGIRLVRFRIRRKEDVKDVYDKIGELNFRRAVVLLEVFSENLVKLDYEHLFKRILNAGFVPKIMQIGTPIDMDSLLSYDGDDVDEDLIEKALKRLRIGNTHITKTIVSVFKENSDLPEEEIAKLIAKEILKGLGVDRI